MFYVDKQLINSGQELSLICYMKELEEFSANKAKNIFLVIQIWFLSNDMFWFLSLLAPHH